MRADVIDGIVVGRAQVDALRVEAGRRFDRRVLAAVAYCFPRVHVALGQDVLLTVVTSGRMRAARSDWRSERAVFLYAAMMLMLGSGFEQDAQYAWVPQTLQQHADEPALDRIFALHTRAMEYLDEVAGAQNEKLIHALLRMRDFDLEQCKGWPPDGFASMLGQTLASLYPARAGALGAGGMQGLVACAAVTAARHDLAGQVAHALVAGLILMLGAEFDSDPALPWASRAMAQDVSAAERLRRLHAAAMDHLAQGLR